MPPIGQVSFLGFQPESPPLACHGRSIESICCPSTRDRPKSSALSTDLFMATQKGLIRSTVCLLVVILAPLYLGGTWILALLLSRDAVRRRAHCIAAAISLGMTAAVALVGVPYTRDSTRMPAFYAAIVLLVLGPLILTQLGRRSKRALASALLILFGLPVLHVEYLTLRHGEELRTAYNAEAGPAARNDPLLFSVFEYTSERATVLRVEGSTGKTFGYFLHFRRQQRWDVETEPQALLWSDSGSAFVACPYPTSVLLLLRGVPSIKC